MAPQHRAIVIDNGSGYTKMGYAGNRSPQFVIPTAIAYKANRTASSSAMDDLDYYIGNLALSHNKTHQVHWPVRHGQIDNWDHMEAFWARCIFGMLKCAPEEHHVLLTEPPMNAPENREQTAEIMFETFGVPGLYIAVQAVCALVASWSSRVAVASQEGHDSISKLKETLLTGTVIDSGDGVTHIIPVIEGYAISSAVKHIPIAGRELTLFIQQSLRERGEPVTPEDSLDISRRIKEQLCYVCPDVVREFQRYEQEPEKYRKSFSWTDSVTGKVKELEVGHERFMAPEIFFSPEISSGDFSMPLPVMVDSVIQSCPIDGRRGLYNNIVLSGGSTMFKDLTKRLQRDIKNLVDTRLQYSNALNPVNKAAAPITVTVNNTNDEQQYAVWYGGAYFASHEQFPSYCTLREEYEEHGPSICRQSRVFGSVFS